jgi:succinate dehydrogenase flavin-adding protein (antitoxin of CptAB toxin-antitoxin module)
MYKYIKMINFLLGTLNLLDSKNINDSILNNIYTTILKIDDDELFNLANSYDLKDYDYDIDLLLEVINKLNKNEYNKEINSIKIKINNLKNNKTI